MAMTQSMKELIHYCESKSLEQHPYLQQLKTQPADLAKVHHIIANAHPFAANFCTMLAGLISRLEDPRIQSLLAKQLNDELGNGDYTKLHIRLYERMLESLAKFGAGNSKPLSPGQRLKAEAARCFASENPYEALGAAMAGEIFAAQFDSWLGGELSRQTQLDLKSCDWYVAHEELEKEHAADSSTIAELIPPGEKEQAAVWRGAHAFDRVLSQFLDEVGNQSRGKSN